MRLRDKVALVTGAGSGIGREATRLFAREGAAVVAADVDEQSAAETVRLVEKEGGEARACVADVSRDGDCAAMVAFAERELGRLDVLFNNAGVMLAGDDDAQATDERVWDATMNVNAKGVFLGCKHGIPALRRAGGGSVINTASFVALLGAATSQISYTASKGGVLALSRELGVEFARRGVRVNALCPGPVDTPLLRELYAKDPEQAARRLVHVPMGRFAVAEEIANAALFLASDESSYITATAFMVDGGIAGAYTTPV
jgi:NAD(P)-dependent dehydrogenase (short-subunit alcohol dehydrogenase family)